MLITERSAHATRTPARIRVSQQVAVARPRTEAKSVLANLSNVLAKAGDRQSWLLLALVMLPVIGMIRNFLAFGFER